MGIHSGFEQACGILSERLCKSITKIDKLERERINEIRLRMGKTVSIGFSDGELFVTEAGKLTRYSGLGIKAEKIDIETAFQAACRYSVHSFQKEIAQGFLTISGGNRIGICGTAVVRDGAIETIKDISGLNIRIAREIIGCGIELHNSLYSAGAQSVLIIGPPSSGKTTILRDLCRLLGQAHRLSIIDERNELSASSGGISQNDIGAHSDVFIGYPKADGIITAIRVMSPEIVVCDEIGTSNDVAALETALHSGVKIIATAHSGSIEEVKKRSGVSKLIKAGAFDAIVLLGTGKQLGSIIKIHRTGDKND